MDLRQTARDILTRLDPIYTPVGVARQWLVESGARPIDGVEYPEIADVVTAADNRGYSTARQVRFYEAGPQGMPGVAAAAFILPDGNHFIALNENVVRMLRAEKELFDRGHPTLRHEIGQQGLTSYEPVHGLIAHELGHIYVSGPCRMIARTATALPYLASATILGTKLARHCLFSLEPEIIIPQLTAASAAFLNLKVASRIHEFDANRQAVKITGRPDWILSMLRPEDDRFALDTPSDRRQQRDIQRMR